MKNSHILPHYITRTNHYEEIWQHYSKPGNIKIPAYFLLLILCLQHFFYAKNLVLIECITYVNIYVRMYILS